MNSDKNDLTKLRSLILLLQLWEFGYKSQIFQFWKTCLQKTALTDELTGACVPQVMGEHGNAQQLARRVTQALMVQIMRYTDNPAPEMECGACGPLPAAELRKQDIELSDMMVEAARHGSQKCEEPADAVARVVEE